MINSTRVVQRLVEKVVSKDPDKSENASLLECPCCVTPPAERWERIALEHVPLFLRLIDYTYELYLTRL